MYKYNLSSEKHRKRVQVKTYMNMYDVTKRMHVDDKE